jgi:hypothetical protein
VSWVAMYHVSASFRVFLKKEKKKKKEEEVKVEVVM